MATIGSLTATEAFKLNEAAPALLNEFSFALSGPLEDTTLLELLTYEPESLGKFFGSKSKVVDKMKLRALARVFVGLKELKAFSGGETAPEVVPSNMQSQVQATTAGSSNDVIVPFVRARAAVVEPKKRVTAAFQVCAPPKGLKAVRAEAAHAWKFWAATFGTVWYTAFRLCIWIVPACLVFVALCALWELSCHIVALPFAFVEFLGAVGANLPFILRNLAHSNDGMLRALSNYRGGYQGLVSLPPPSTSSTPDFGIINVSNLSENVTVVFVQGPSSEIDSPAAWPYAASFVVLMWLMNRVGIED